ncbi:MAG TPA: hypothetical protein VER11_25665 [Polyangiaceae bacterium]|nr:hypothetical protein [Polyangiaceae bacterium]
MKLGCVTLATLLWTALASRAFGQDDSAVLAELARQRVALERLERREAERTKAERAEAERAKTEANLRLSGYVQLDWVLHNQASQNEINYSTGAPLNQDRFTLRRAHLRAASERGYLTGAFEIDANTNNGPQVRPINAELGLRFPAQEDPNQPRLSLVAGLIRIPFGFEVQELDSVRPFLERTTAARAFFPGEFDLGARFRAQFRCFDLSVAVMNGHPLGDRSFPALAPTQKKEVIGHLGVQGEVAPGVSLAVGLSADTGYGFHEGNGTSKDRLVWRDENGDGIVQATEVQVIAGSAATPSEPFHRFALGADARLGIRFGEHASFELRAELVRASNLDRAIEPADPVAAGHDLREFGWYLGAIQEVTRWALLGVRYDFYDPDQDAREQRAVQVVPRDRSYRALSFLAMFRYAEARITLQYDLNRNALGRAANGAPTSLASDVLTARAQLRF